MRPCICVLFSGHGLAAESENGRKSNLKVKGGSEIGSDSAANPITRPQKIRPMGKVIFEKKKSFEICVLPLQFIPYNLAILIRKS